jgi:hypothetical protein
MFLLICLFSRVSLVSGTRIVFFNQEMVAPVFTLADGGIGDWFGGILFSAGQQANEAVLDQLSSLSFTRCTINSSE